METAMIDRGSVIKGLEICANNEGAFHCPDCPYAGKSEDHRECGEILCNDAVSVIRDLTEENRALRLLLEWADDCGFGFDQFQEEHDRYKDEIEDMSYTEGMIHVAKRVLEDQRKARKTGGETE